MPVLVTPSVAYRESYLAALREFHAEGRNTHLDAQRIAADFGTFVHNLLDESERTKVTPGRVPASTYWLVEGDTFIGRISVRHELNDHLRKIGGHIGYEIRPSVRRRGYGTEGLRLALEEARKLGLSKVLVTCDVDNVASRRIIEHNGGILEVETKIEEHDVPIARYWIDLD